MSNDKPETGSMVWIDLTVDDALVFFADVPDVARRLRLLRRLYLRRFPRTFHRRSSPSMLRKRQIRGGCPSSSTCTSGEATWPAKPSSG